MNLFFQPSFQFQFSNVEGRGLLGARCGQLSGANVNEGQRERLPALRQVRVSAQEVVHARHRLHLQPVDQVRN